MTVGNGRQFLSIPGPSTVPDEVLAAMQRPAVDIYSGEMIGITDSCLKDLASVFRTNGRVYIYAANGHGGWEAALTNVLSRGDVVLALECGRFAVGWGGMARMLGVEVEVLPGDWRRAVDPAALEARLRRDKTHAIKAILTVQIDTASGVVNDIPAIRKAMDAAGHPALLMVDAVASLGCMPFEMDAWGVDVVVTGSQKAWMSAPGLAMIAASPRAWAAMETATMPRFYLDLRAHRDSHAAGQTPWTPAIAVVYQVDEGIRLMQVEGAAAVFARHEACAAAVRAGLVALGFELFADQRFASRTVTAARVPDDLDWKAFNGELKRRGLILAGGQGKLAGKIFRLGHLGSVTVEEILGAMSVLEFTSIAMGRAVRPGAAVAAAQVAALESFGVTAAAPVGAAPA
jgi:alanine-glyoxylate transaminase/serine-glyoxylate transaminase/serine-pyruvate transaminase